MTELCIEAEDVVGLILGEERNLRRLARRRVRCPSAADDLVQETLLRAYRARDRFQPGTSVRAWTATILHRVYLTGAIRDKRRRTRCDTDSAEILDLAVDRRETPGSAPPPDVASFRDRLDDDVKRAFDRIPDAYGTSFFLLTIAGLTCNEIAHQLRVPPGTVMSRVHRAREQLKSELASRRLAYQPRVCEARTLAAPRFRDSNPVRGSCAVRPTHTGRPKPTAPVRPSAKETQP